MTTTPPSPPPQQAARSRYPGTRPFSDSPDDYIRFFGRAEESEQLYLRVLSVPLLVQFGRSGLGKTSLLQAGLFPRLRQRPFLPVMIRLNNPGESLTAAVARSLRQACETAGLEYAEGLTEGVWELLSTTPVWHDDLLLTPVLVFDQFEEVFTLRDAAFRAELAAELGALASGDPPERLRSGRRGSAEGSAAGPGVKIVISLREDYLGALEEFSAAIPGLFSERLRLEALTEAAARSAITGPARLVAEEGEEPYWAPGFEFEPAALDDMIRYLKGKSGIIEPFQLQLLCRHAEAIAHRRAKKETEPVTVTLTGADFQGAQAFAVVLENFYRDTLHKLPGSQRKWAEALCEQGLLGAYGHRLMLEETQIYQKFRRITPATLAFLAQERIISKERRLESTFYEIGHDRLAESIGAMRGLKLPAGVKRWFWAAVFVAILALGLLLWWNRTVQRARADAEGLLAFMLGESFLGEVRDIGRSAMLEQVQEQVDRSGGGARWAALNRGLALRNRGDIQRTHGRLTDAVNLFDEALAAIEGADDPAVRREVARTRERLGDALTDQGEPSKALSHYHAAIETWRQVVRDPATSGGKQLVSDCASLADALVSAGELKDAMGQTTAALADFHESLGVASNLLFGGQGPQATCAMAGEEAEPYPDAKALEVFSRAALARAILFGVREDHEGAEELAMQASWLRPPSISARTHSIVALAWRGNARRYEDPQSALEDYRRALAEFEELRRWDPDNRLWQRERAASQLLVAEGIVACVTSATAGCAPTPALEEAEAIVLEATATLRELAQIDAANLSLKYDLGWALGSLARVFAAQDRKTERLAMLEEAQRAFSVPRRDEADLKGIAWVGRVLSDKSDALAELGRLPAAQKAVQEAIGVFTKLGDAHPTAPVFWTDLALAREREAVVLRLAGDEAAAAKADAEAARLNKRYWDFAGSFGEKQEELNESDVRHVDRGAELYEREDYSAALREFEAAAAAGREYVLLRPAAFGGHRNLSNTYEWIQLTRHRLDETEEQAGPLRASMYAAEMAVWLAPEGNEQVEMNDRLMLARYNFAVYLYRNGHLVEALAMVQEVVVVAEGLVQGAPGNKLYQANLGLTKCELGMVRRDLRKSGWEEAIRSGLIHIRRAAEIDSENAQYRKKLGEWRRYLAQQFDELGRKGEAEQEYELALKAYREAAALAPSDEETKKAILELVELETKRGARLRAAK